jgi:hypothetical protein
MRFAIFDGFVGALCSLPPLDVYSATIQFEALKKKRKKKTRHSGNEKV